MKTLYYCHKNDFQIKRLSKTLIDLYPNVKIKEKGCLGKCKTCKSCPFLLVDGEMFKSKTVKKLSVKVGKRIVSTTHD
jgi:uncharacterized protein YuzB (UPF0349 family)